MKILVLNGPNLNLLGTREPELYGHESLADIETMLRQRAESLELRLSFAQHNGEGALISAVHDAQSMDGILLNAGAYTHSSIALRDALLAVKTPTWLVHLSEPENREPFRRVDYLADVALGRTAGQGAQGYLVALEALAQHLRTRG